jgi:hypothetical protein
MGLENLIKKVYTKLNNKEKRENLEKLVSEFWKITSDKSAPTIEFIWVDKEVQNYYNYLDKNINNFDLADAAQLTGNEPLYKIIAGDYIENLKFGLFSSALINKKIKEDDKIKIITPTPINYLFYKLENAEAYVNRVGDYLGYKSKNSKIYAEEAEKYSGYMMENCELHVKKAGPLLGYNSKNSKIYAGEAGDYAGEGIDGCELHLKEAGKRLGSDAKNSKIYAEEAGDGAGYYMENSELFIYKLNGSLAYSCLEVNNKIYLGEESYKKFIRKYPKYIGKVKLWEKQN